MESTLSRKRKISIALLSLAIHLILFLILFVTITDPTTRKKWLQQQRIKLLKTLQQLPKRSSQWAATKARASQFGAPVMFMNSPAEQTNQATTQVNNQKQEEQQKPMQKAVSPAVAKKETMAAQKYSQEIAQQEQREELPQNTVREIAQKKVEHIKQSAQEVKATDHPLPPQKNLKEEIEKSPAIPEQISHTKVMETHHQPTQKEEKVFQKKVTPQPKKQLTLAHITKGFLEQLKNKGDHAVTMRGDKNKLPTDEQLKHERYLQRLQWCLQNSMKIHQRKYTPRQSVKTSLDMYIALDKSGTLTELKLLRSSGITELDEFMLFAFQDASSSFPPVPGFFKKELYTIIFTVKINEMPQPGFRLFMQ